MIEYVKRYRKTLFLKISLVFMYVPVVLITIFATPSLYFEAVKNNEINVYFVLPFVILMVSILIPSGLAVIETIKLFTNIEKGNYYSEKTIRGFNIIKACGIVAGILFMIMLPSVFYFAEMDDAPGLGLIGLVFVAAGIFIAIFASVMKDVVRIGIEK